MRENASRSSIRRGSCTDRVAVIEDEDTIAKINDSHVMRQFNKAFQFIQINAEKVSPDDDAIDQSLKNVLLGLLDEQRGQVQRAWLKSNRQEDQTEESEEVEGSFQDFIDLLSDVELNEMLRLILPIVKLESGKYMIGTKVRLLQQKGDILLARVGGGYIDLSQAISSEAKIHCL